MPEYSINIATVNGEALSTAKKSRRKISPQPLASSKRRKSETIEAIASAVRKRTKSTYSEDDQRQKEAAASRFLEEFTAIPVEQTPTPLSSSSSPPLASQPLLQQSFPIIPQDTVFEFDRYFEEYQQQQQQEQHPHLPHLPNQYDLFRFLRELCTCTDMSNLRNHLDAFKIDELERSYKELMKARQQIEEERKKMDAERKMRDQKLEEERRLREEERRVAEAERRELQKKLDEERRIRDKYTQMLLENKFNKQ